MTRELHVNPDQVDRLDIPDNITSDVFASMRYIEAAEDEADYAGDFADDNTSEMTEEDIKNTSEYVGTTKAELTDEEDYFDDTEIEKPKANKYPKNYTLRQYKSKKSKELKDFFEKMGKEIPDEFALEILTAINSSAAMGISFDKMDEYINFTNSFRQMEICKMAIILDPEMKLYNEIKGRKTEDMVKLIRITIENNAIQQYETDFSAHYNATVDELQGKINQYMAKIKEYETERQLIEENHLAEMEDLKQRYAESERQISEYKKIAASNNCPVEENSVEVANVNIEQIIRKIINEKDLADKERFDTLLNLFSDKATEVKSEPRKIKFKRKKDDAPNQKVDFMEYVNNAGLDPYQLKVITAAIEGDADEDFLRKLIEQKDEHKVMMEKVRMYMIRTRIAANNAKKEENNENNTEQK
ncbi:MAG: hypothetical protein K5750_04190 [Eubacterium sp.]|nr:hypothetical protein [Eubacterium sp.]